MARRIRIQFPGARYHIINRGNYRHDVFTSEGLSTAASLRPTLFLDRQDAQDRRRIVGVSRALATTAATSGLTPSGRPLLKGAGQGGQTQRAVLSLSWSDAFGTRSFEQTARQISCTVHEADGIKRVFGGTIENQEFSEWLVHRAGSQLV